MLELSTRLTNELLLKVKESQEDLTDSIWRLIDTLRIERDLALKKLEDNGLSSTSTTYTQKISSSTKNI